MKASSALNALSALYLAGASAFGIAIALQRNPEMSAAAGRAANTVWPAIQRGAGIANERAVQPALRKLVEADKAFFDAIDPPRTAVASTKPAQRVARTSPPSAVARRATPPLRPAIVEPQRAAKAETPEPKIPAAQPPERAAKAPQEIAKASEAPAKPVLRLAPEEEPARAAAAQPPRPAIVPPSAAELSRVMLRLRDNLTSEMLEHFELFLYVSKASSGPWAQRMYVFRKEAGGNLDLLYNWPVSTGRELNEYAPTGVHAPSLTPSGYYELDPDRMYRHHVSGQWGSPMPYAMFFNWERRGLQTGLAIHAASGSGIADLGHRASAGCVRLAPENAALLFNLIRADYKGLAPRFAYDRRTATMSNDGLLMHDADGKIQFAEGYKVLVFIEDYGGENVVAALF